MQQKIAVHRNRQERFLWVTKPLDLSILSDEAMLCAYKEQTKAEKWFPFIKDEAFEVPSIFLKKPERIAALMMIMTLCFMMYGISEYELRETLKIMGDAIPSQTKKETAKPSRQWVYRLFQGVQVITLILGDVVQTLVMNLKSVQKKIIRHFGKRAMEIYGAT